MAPRDSVTRMVRLIRAWPATEPLAAARCFQCLRQKWGTRTGMLGLARTCLSQAAQGAASSLGIRIRL
jgi:hypothetical protein